MQSETHLIVKWRLMIKKKKRRSKRQESRPHVGQLCLQSDLSNFIFVLVNIISCSGKYTPRISQVSWKGRRKAGYSPLRLSLIPRDCHMTRTYLHLIQSEVYRKPCAHHQWNSTRGGHSSASMLAPKLRMTVMKSIVYLEDGLRSASRRCPRLFFSS